MTGGYTRSAALMVFLNCRSRRNVIRAASLLTFLIVIRDLA